MDISNFILERFASEHGRFYAPYSNSPKNVLAGEFHGDKYDEKPQVSVVRII